MLKSSMHKNKQIVTVSEFVTMVRDQNWKKDVSYILIEEDIGENEWKETGLYPVSNIFPETLVWDADRGFLQCEDDTFRYDMDGITEGTVISELVDSMNDDTRYTIYMT